MIIWVGGFARDLDVLPNGRFELPSALTDASPQLLLGQRRGRQVLRLPKTREHQAGIWARRLPIGVRGGNPISMARLVWTLRGNKGVRKPHADESHFKTDHLLANLRSRTISSGFVTVVAQSAKFVLSLASTMVLARLLTPRDFGLVAMVTTVMGFLQVFKDAGLSTATVQQESITHAQVSNLFWINVGISGFMGVTVVASSPVIAWFYREPRLVPIALVLSLTFLLSGSTVQHLALLNRQMRFKVIALIEVGSMSVGFLTGILMALRGYGYWSLIGASLSMEATGVLFTWSASRWRPQLPARLSGTRPLLRFGASLSAGSFIYHFSSGVDSALIGQRYGPDSVGLYSRAMALLMRPLEQLLNPINAVLLPALSRLQTQPERYRRTFLQVYDAIALAGFACAGLLLALAHPLTLVLLGPTWEEAAVIFAAFTIAALYLPLSMPCSWLFTSQGRAKEFFYLTMILCALTVAAFVIGLPFGPAGVAISFSVSGVVIRLPIIYYFSGRHGPVTTLDLWAVFFRHLPLWVVVFGATYLIRTLVIDFAPLAELFICAPVGVAAAIGTIFALRPLRIVALHTLRTAREVWLSK